MLDLAEAMEIATLDKEMAKEKCEVLKSELEKTREKLEELQIDYEIMKTDVGQRKRLKEALVKLRDLSAQEKQEQQRSQEMDQMKSKEKLSLLVDDYEKQLGELKEQVDAALGSEEMVELLTDRNLTLEDRVKELQVLVDDLERLQDVNDQLQESAKETELELREEVDLATAKIREGQRKLEAMQDAIADYEQTIYKFRDQTEQLRETNHELHMQMQKESDRVAMSQPVEFFDFKVKFAEPKPFARAVEMDLRRLEVQEASQHVKYLCAFMPDNFLNRGSDHAAIQVLLLVPRMITKSEILASQVKEKFPCPAEVTKDNVLKTHKIDQYAFACRLLYQLHFLQSLLHQYVSALSTELEKALKAKSDELSEMRKEMAEKKLEIATKDDDERVDRTQRQLDEAEMMLKKEKEFEETLDHLQADIDALETERGELKDKIKLISKKAILEGLSKTTSLASLVASPISPTVPGSALSSVVLSQDSSLLSQQVQEHVRDENWRLQMDQMKRQLASLPPLKVPQKHTGLFSTTSFRNMIDLQDESFVDLSKKSKELLEKAHVLYCPILVDISHRKPGVDPTIEKMAAKNHLVESTVKLKSIQNETQKLKMEIANLGATQRSGTRIDADFSSFPDSRVLKDFQRRSRDSQDRLPQAVQHRRTGSGSSADQHAGNHRPPFQNPLLMHFSTVVTLIILFPQRVDSIQTQNWWGWCSFPQSILNPIFTPLIEKLRIIDFSLVFYCTITYLV